jgi:hypothetical protein
VALPGFINKASPFPRLEEDYYWTSMKRNVYFRHNFVSYRMDKKWRMIPQPQKERSESGIRAWSALRNACDNLQCEECRIDCRMFINGLHDAINIKLGKAMRTPNDF